VAYRFAQCRIWGLMLGLGSGAGHSCVFAAQRMAGKGCMAAEPNAREEIRTKLKSGNDAVSPEYGCATRRYSRPLKSAAAQRQAVGPTLQKRGLER